MSDIGNKVINVSERNNTSIEFPEQSDRDNFIIMDVGEPVTITAKESYHRSVSFTTYLIRVETNYPTFTNTFSAVRRRYSEFCWLRDQLAANHNDEVVPSLPPKKYLRIINFNAKVIEERRVGLSRFLQRVLETPAYLSDPALLFFLQSDLSVAEMEENATKSKKPVSFHNSVEVSTDPMGHSEESSVSVNNISMNDKQLVRRHSTESDESDRVSSDGSCYESSKADSGHFEGSSSGVSLTGSGSLNTRRRFNSIISKPRVSSSSSKAQSSSSRNQLPGNTLSRVITLSNPMAYYLLGQS